MLKITFKIEDPGDDYDSLMMTLMEMGAEDIEDEQFTPEAPKTTGGPKRKTPAAENHGVN